MRKVIFILCLFLSISTLRAQNSINGEEYIARFRDFAVIEMHRSGVPASITMAQGILESSNGNSRLAREGNNHFGIKCKSDWTGPTIYADDDAPNECFRAYPSALESYMDHSHFLKNNWRYQALFELERTDYKGWAEGLRKAGYATNPKYAEILINLIERYKLYELDYLPAPAGSGVPKLEIVNNDVPAVYVEKDETAKSIAERNGLKERHIYKYNDLKEGAELNEGDIIYLKPKRRKGNVEYHVVQPGESMYAISQQNGIQLKHLYKKNRMEEGEEPAPGEKIYLQKKREKEEEVETAVQSEVKKEPAPFVNPNSAKTPEVTNAPESSVVPVEVPEFHVVAAGDNIYRIAEKYQILEEDLLKWNRLNALELKIGMKIYLNESAARRNLPAKEEVVPVKVQEEKKTPAANAAEYHTVQPGETVYRICKQYGITADQLQKWNNLNGNQINVGQRLRVK